MCSQHGGELQRLVRLLCRRGLVCRLVQDFHFQLHLMLLRDETADQEDWLRFRRHQLVKADHTSRRRDQHVIC